VTPGIGCGGGGEDHDVDAEGGQSAGHLGDRSFGAAAGGIEGFEDVGEAHESRLIHPK
jgi:hypothetical protein